MFDLPDKCTIWNKAGNDGFGGVSWDGPYKVMCRIAEKAEKFTDTNGDTLTSTSVLYSDSEFLKVDSQVLQFEHSDATIPPSEANDVRQRSRTPSGTTMQKAWFS